MELFKYLFALAVIISLIGHIAWANIINVPGDQPTIQQGLNVALEGDTVLVQPDTYVENINFPGHNIVLGSLFITTGDTSYISSTTIDGNATATVVTFGNGQESTAEITGFTITNGNADIGGGLLCQANSNPTISNSIVTGNSAAWGGGILCWDSNPTIINNTISANSAASRGGGIYCYNANPPISGNTISYNSASNGGGIQCEENSNPTISFNTISANSAYGESGGGVSCVNSNPTISDNTISGNSADDDEGGGIQCAYCTNPAIINNTIIGNSANTGGGIQCFDANPTISNNIIKGNSAIGDGGGIQCAYSTNPIIMDNTISLNTANAGGGIFCFDSNPTISNDTISVNSAGDNGGGINCVDSSPTITNNTIRQNSAENGGGGIYCVNASPIISNNTIIANIIGGEEGLDMGGGICCVYCLSLTIDSNIISGNFAYAGGGINCFEAHPSISNNTINDNLAYGGGGIGLCCGSYPMIGNNTINGNEAYDLGGGIYCNSGSNATISDNIFSDNVGSGAFSYGGAICCNESNPTISGNTVSGNSARNGGGISCRANSDPPIINNTISENSANSGGGIQCDNNSDPTLENCIIAFSTQGEAVYCSDGTAIPTLTCCDVHGNAGGDWVGCIAAQFGINGNICEDPLFCGGENPEDPYTLHSNSPCAPFSPPNEECDLIGARPVACGPVPVVLASFQATSGLGFIALNWVTASEINCHRWEVYRGEQEDGEYAKIAELSGHGSTETEHTYQWVDRRVSPEVTYFYKLKQIDLDGSSSWSNTVSASVSSAVPKTYALHQNYPNPFNPVTEITYAVPGDIQVTLKVYNVLGAELATLVDEEQAADFYTVCWNADGLASGVYFCRLKAGDFEKTIKMLFLK